MFIAPNDITLQSSVRGKAPSKTQINFRNILKIFEILNVLDPDL